MNRNETLAWIHGRMAALADPAHREGAQRFFQNEVEVWGVRSADLQPLVRQVFAEVKRWPRPEWNKLCADLWPGKLEEGVLVCHVYRRFARECAACEFKLFERWIERYVHNWAHCDGVASWLLAACIENQPSLADALPEWTESENRWKRRAAAVAFLQEAKQGRCTGEILAQADRLLPDPDVMVQKGVGWLLKEAYPKQPEAVVEFLLPRRSRTTRLVLRYAAEKMTAADRKLLLG